MPLSRAPGVPQRDWARANRYVGRHLAAHAAAGGMLLELLVDDPQFLTCGFFGVQRELG
jgi:hypothetical protein